MDAPSGRSLARRDRARARKRRRSSSAIAPAIARGVHAAPGRRRSSPSSPSPPPPCSLSPPRACSHTTPNQTSKQPNETDKLVDDPTFRKAPRGVGSILDDSASTLFVTEVFRGMAYTLKAFFDPKLTINYPFEKGAISESQSSMSCRGPHHCRRPPSRLTAPRLSPPPQKKNP